MIAASAKPVMERYVGLTENGEDAALDTASLNKIIAVKLAAMGFYVPTSDDTLNVAHDLFRVYREQARLLDEHLCPIDTRIQAFLNDVLKETGDTELPQLPRQTLESDRWGLSKVRTALHCTAVLLRGLLLCYTLILTNTLSSRSRTQSFAGTLLPCGQDRIFQLRD